jgi:hypothetical protein
MKEIHHCFIICQQRKLMPTICFVCLDKNEGIRLHVHVGLFFVLKWGFICFPILGLLGAMKRGLQPHQRKIKRREELPFSVTTFIHFFIFPFSSFPSIVFVVQD